MSRASVVYLFMIVALVAGLWAIMSLGGRLTAPEDLNGRWEAIGGATAWPGLTVEQSGKFFQLAFDNGPPEVAVTMVGRADNGRLSLERGAWHVTIDGSPGQAIRTFRVDGPTSGTFTGRRAVPSTAPASKEAK